MRNQVNIWWTSRNASKLSDYFFLFFLPSKSCSVLYFDLLLARVKASNLDIMSTGRTFSLQCWFIFHRTWKIFHWTSDNKSQKQRERKTKKISVQIYRMCLSIKFIWPASLNSHCLLPSDYCTFSLVDLWMKEINTETTIRKQFGFFFLALWISTLFSLYFALSLSHILSLAVTRKGNSRSFFSVVNLLKLITILCNA